jgi:hypothetical protein
MAQLQGWLEQRQRVGIHARVRQADRPGFPARFEAALMAPEGIALPRTDLREHSGIAALGRARGADDQDSSTCARKAATGES